MLANTYSRNIGGEQRGGILGAVDGLLSDLHILSRNAGFLNDYYDDEGWWALAWLATYDLTNKRLHFYLDDPRPPADCNVLMQHRAETNCYCGSALSGLPPKLRREW